MARLGHTHAGGEDIGCFDHERGPDPPDIERAVEPALEERRDAGSVLRKRIRVPVAAPRYRPFPGIRF